MLDKAIASGKEYRTIYYGSKAIDKTCRNGGSCFWCLANRQYKNKKRLEKMLDKHLEAMYNGDVR